MLRIPRRQSRREIDPLPGGVILLLPSSSPSALALRPVEMSRSRCTPSRPERFKAQTEASPLHSRCWTINEQNGQSADSQAKGPVRRAKTAAMSWACRVPCGPPQRLRFGMLPGTRRAPSHSPRCPRIPDGAVGAGTTFGAGQPTGPTRFLTRPVSGRASWEPPQSDPPSRVKTGLVRRRACVALGPRISCTLAQPHPLSWVARAVAWGTGEESQSLSRRKGPGRQI